MFKVETSFGFARGAKYNKIMAEHSPLFYTLCPPGPHLSPGNIYQDSPAPN